MNDTKSAAFLSELSQLEDTLRAGVGSLEKDEITKLIEKINYSINETTQKDYLKKAGDRRKIPGRTDYCRWKKRGLHHSVTI